MKGLNAGRIIGAMQDENGAAVNRLTTKRIIDAARNGGGAPVKNLTAGRIAVPVRKTEVAYL